MEWRPAGLSVCLPLISPLAPQSPEEDFFWHRLTRVVPEKRAVIKRLRACSLMVELFVLKCRCDLVASSEGFIVIMVAILAAGRVTYYIFVHLKNFSQNTSFFRSLCTNILETFSYDAASAPIEALLC